MQIIIKTTKILALLRRFISANSHLTSVIFLHAPSPNVSQAWRNWIFWIKLAMIGKCNFMGKLKSKYKIMNNYQKTCLLCFPLVASYEMQEIRLDYSEAR